MKKSIIACLACLSSALWSDSYESPSLVREGNFAVRAAAQPGPIFSIGQNLLNKHDVIVSTNPVFAHGEDHLAVVAWEQNVLYGITNTCSLLITPTSLNLRNPIHDLKAHSSGFGDLPIELEYAYHVIPQPRAVWAFTVLGSVNLPTGSAKKSPQTGLGSPSFLLGTTASYMSVDWFAFVDLASLITTKYHQIDYGYGYFYECGVGRNLVHLKDWVFMAEFEVDGILVRPTRVSGIKNPNTGSNTIFVGPSLYLASNLLTFDFGVQWPILQTVRGAQNKFDYRITGGFGIIF